MIPLSPPMLPLIPPRSGPLTAGTAPGAGTEGGAVS
jgi:hypothetical protein